MLHVAPASLRVLTVTSSVDARGEATIQDVSTATFKASSRSASSPQSDLAATTARAKVKELEDEKEFLLREIEMAEKMLAVVNRNLELNAHGIP